MDNGQVLISAQSVSKVFRMGEVDVPALRDVSIDIYDGEFLAIAGPSGSGKSTLLNLIGGMDRPTSGTMTFLDRALSAFTDAELTLYRRRQIGFVFQFYNLVPTLTALENVQVAIEIADAPMDGMEALRWVGLEHRAHHFPSQLSGGEQQRVSIARALSSNPRLLLCDEPTGALDLATSKQILGLLLDLNQSMKKTVVLITHNNAITGLAHRKATIRDGAIRSIEILSERKTIEAIEW